jgi:cephalosporin hydroxylase
MVLQTIHNSNLPNDGEKNEDDKPSKINNDDIPLIMKSGIKEEITKQVVRKKLAKQRHLVIQKAIHPEYLDSLFPTLLSNFQPQTVHVSLFHITIIVIK